MIIDILLKILLGTAIVLGIVILIWFIYWTLWTAFFIPMNKSLRYHERKAKLNQEFNKIEVKIERAEDELDILRADYRDTLVSKDKAEAELVKKQELMKKYNDELKEFRKWKLTQDKTKPESISNAEEKVEMENEDEEASKSNEPKKDKKK